MGSVDRPVYVSTRDGRVFFDQLAVPLELRRCLGRPMVKLSDLLAPPACESGCPAEPGLSMAELAAFMLDGPVAPTSDWLAPVCNTWPMGFGWSSYVAQSTMLASCKRVGYDETYFSRVSVFFLLAG